MQPPPLVPPGFHAEAAAAAAAATGQCEGASSAPSGADYLEAAGLPPLWRDAARAARARTHAVVWVAAFTPPTPGNYSVVLAFERSEEHVAGSPYIVAVAA